MAAGLDRGARQLRRRTSASRKRWTAPALRGLPFTLLVALYLAPFLIYMLLAALYESLVLPFAVLLAVPLALFGGLGGLVLFHQTLNLFSLLGAVMLVGGGVQERNHAR